MDDLIKAIQAKDLIKTQRLFNEAMQPLVAKIIQEQKLLVARAVIIEGEELHVDEDEDDEDEDEHKKD